MKIKQIIKALIGISLICVLIYISNLDRLIDTISSANPYFLLSAVSVTTVTMFFRFFRWKVLVNTVNNKISFIKTIKIYLVGTFFGSVTPSKIGDLVKYRYLVKNNIGPGKSISISVLDKVFDIIIVSSVSMMGLFLLVGLLNIIIFPILILVFSVVYLIFNENFFKRVLIFLISKPRLLKIFRINYKIDEDKSSNNIYAPFKYIKNNKLVLISLLFLSILIWLSLSFQVSLILNSMGIFNSNILYIFVFICIGSIITLIPITISGLGTREATFIFLFSLIGIQADKTILMSIIYYFFSQIIPSIFGGIIFLTNKGDV